MKHIILILLLAASGAPLAENAPGGLGQLKVQLSVVREEQQSVYHNYQMTRELRLKEVQEGSPPMGLYPNGTGIDTAPPNYEDVLRAQLEREGRIQQYTSDLVRLSARFLDLENQKKALLKQIKEMEQHPDQ